MNKQMSNKLKKHIELLRELTLENIMLKHTIETLKNKNTMGLRYNKRTPKVLFYIHKKFF